MLQNEYQVQSLRAEFNTYLDLWGLSAFARARWSCEVPGQFEPKLLISTGIGVHTGSSQQENRIFYTKSYLAIISDNFECLSMSNRDLVIGKWSTGSRKPKPKCQHMESSAITKHLVKLQSIRISNQSHSLCQQWVKLFTHCWQMNLPN